MSNNEEIEIKLKFWEKMMIRILRSGRIPNHIAFIMDGNRRYAKSKGMEKTQGHFQGLEALKKCLQYCLELGVKVVTVYAFALDNFKREKTEVEALMNLAKINLRKMADHDQFLQKHSIKVNICGKMEVIPEDVRQSMEEIIELTHQNNKLKLNICFAYSSTHEIQSATEKMLKDYEDGQITAEDMTIDRFNSYLLVPDYPDVLVRSGNESRLSDFLTFQSQDSQLIFLKESWPEINIFSMVKIIINYQLYY